MKTKAKTKQPTTPAQLVEAMQTFGAEFQFTDAGSLFVGNLAKLPAVVIDDFLEADQRQMCAAVRALPCSATAEVATR